MAISAVADYQQKKRHLLTHIQAYSPAKASLRLRKKTSNLFRHRPRSATHWLDLTAFNQVLSIDPVNLIAEVEGLVTYEDFVDAALTQHCLPAIVPELKSITVGGAIAGLGAESSSFRYGWVHETALEIEVLLPHGEVVICTPDNEHSDLFYALPSSYGSLGYVLKAKMRLIAVKPYVKLTRLHFTDPEQYFNKLMELSNHPGDIDYIDGVSLQDDLYITLGQFSEQAPFLSNYRYLNIYYQSIPVKPTDYLTTLDYIWRWDADWFWCSKYFLMQNPVVRRLLGKWLLKSTVYWRIMHFMNAHSFIRKLTHWIMPATETIIQDLQIPAEKACQFYQFFKQEIKIDPMLICPLRMNPQLAQFMFCPLQKNQIYINFGAYGNFIPSEQESGYVNRRIENKVAEAGGNKWLYSNVFYSAQEFWNLYDKNAYCSLKAKYDPHNLLRDIYTKCTEKIL